LQIRTAGKHRSKLKPESGLDTGNSSIFMEKDLRRLNVHSPGRRTRINCVRPAGSRLLEVTAVSQAESESAPSPRFTLNTDGQRHPAINLAAGYSVVAGITSTELGLLSVAAVAGSVL